VICRVSYCCVTGEQTEQLVICRVTVIVAESLQTCDLIDS